jgi:hypothetical protein
MLSAATIPPDCPSEAHVLAPALFVPGAWEEAYRDAVNAASVLRQIIARGREERRAAPLNLYGVLFALFGIASGRDADLPVAAATGRFDLPQESADGGWVRADPVHLRPDMGKLLLYGAPTLALTTEEAVRLAEEINSVLVEEGLRVLVGRDPGRWYLHLNSVPAIKTFPPTAASGQHIDPFLPGGPDARQWHRLANDIQMMLHRSPLNAAREARGEPAVNSVWFWGCGALPPLRSSWTVVVTDFPTAAGLAMAAGTPCAEPAPLHPPAAGRSLCVPSLGHDDLLRGDAGAWREQVQALDSVYLAPLLAAVRRGTLAAITVHLPGAAYTLRRRDLWRIWRQHLPRFTASP